eukprot:6436078-Pyramimonas_sp.AAC.1
MPGPAAVSPETSSHCAREAWPRLNPVYICGPDRHDPLHKSITVHMAVLSPPFPPVSVRRDSRECFARCESF